MILYVGVRRGRVGVARPVAALTHVGAVVPLAVVRARGDGTGRTSCWIRSPVRLLILDDVVPACATGPRGLREESSPGADPRLWSVGGAGYVVLVASAVPMTDRLRPCVRLVEAAQRVGS